jgi:hypothetical protein
MEHHRDSDRQLDELFRSYRGALPDPEPAAHFSVRLWEKIEGRRSVAFSVKRWTQTLVASAVTLCALMAVLLWTPSENPLIASATYVEFLSQEQPPELLAYADYEQEFNER